MPGIHYWLEELYVEFEADVRQLMETEPLWQVCLACPDGGCCRKQAIPVMQPEWENLTGHVRGNFSAVEKRRYEQNVERKRDHCPFLVKDRCNVYQVRPWACRIFPYTISYHQSEISQDNGEFIAPHCASLREYFGTRPGEVKKLETEVVERAEGSSLVKVRIPSGKAFWVIDITKYQAQYEASMPKNKSGALSGDDIHNWVRIARYALDSGAITYSKYLEILGLD